MAFLSTFQFPPEGSVERRRQRRIEEDLFNARMAISGASMGLARTCLREAARGLECPAENPLNREDA